MQLNQFLNELFQATPNYSLTLALAKLRAFGGISSLLNSLAIDHRQIINIYQHKIDYNVPSRINREEDKNSNKLIKSQVELENILLYLVTLSFFTKLLLFDNSMRLELNVYSEIISFIMLIFIMVQKKSRRKLQGIEINQDHLIINPKQFKVRRNGYQKLFDQQEVEQGDIVYLQKGDFIKFDGIILDIVQNSSQLSNEQEKPASFIFVNQEQVGTGRNKCNKNTVWNIQEKCLKDPFLLANTKILSGSVWILVCLGVKSNPSKRNDVQLGSALKLSKLSYQVQQVILLAVIVLVVYLSSVWMVGSQMSGYDIFLQMIYLISSLILYLSYANTTELLQGLKRYLKQKTTGKGYRIVNPKLLEKFSEVDLIIIEDNCLSKDLSLITKINKSIDLKIVTNSFIGNMFRFGNINDELIFYPQQNKKLIYSLDQLIKSKFISLQYDQFRNNFLSIFRELKYSMVYVSRSREAMDKFQDVITIKCSEINVSSTQRLQTEWMRISQGVCTEEVLLDLIEKARVYKRFEQSFYAVVINNCIELTMLIGWALAGCLVDLNLNLLIIFSNRNRVKQFYQALHDSNHEQSYKAKGIVFSIQINFIFLLYYIYMNWEIQESNNRQFMLFLILMANRMFRIQALLRQKNINSLLNRMFYKSLAIIGLIIFQALIKWQLGYRSDFVSQSLDILLLPLILFLFVLFL